MDRLDLDAPATVFMRGTLANRPPSAVNPRFGGSLRLCLYHFLITAKPHKDWMILETDDGELQLLGPEIDTLLASDIEIRREVRLAKDEFCWEPRRQVLLS